jgi:hypothetical protein
MKPQQKESMQVGDIFERRNGSRLMIEYFTPGYAHSWLARGSKPQFRYIGFERLQTRCYKLVGWEEVE